MHKCVQVSPEEVTGSPGGQVTVVVSCQTWVLGTELGSSASLSIALLTWETSLHLEVIITTIILSGNQEEDVNREFDMQGTVASWNSLSLRVCECKFIC